jgi:hypothetical protein
MEPKKPHPNRRQLPVFISKDNSSETPTSQNDKNYHSAEILDENSRLPSESSNNDLIESNKFHVQTGLTLSRALGSTCPPTLAKCNLDFRDLSLLASHEVGRYTGQKLLECPQSISNFLGRKTWSYCHYVPLHYSQCVLIRNAADCAVARTRCLLSPENTEWESLALLSYGKALLSLQEAMDSTSQHPTAEILCATQILGVYEASSYLPYVRALSNIIYPRC